jgi:hypothetical protein
MAKAAAGGDQSAFLRAYRGTMLASAPCHFTTAPGGTDEAQVKSGHDRSRFQPVF